ncbi:hypothetical protein B0I35DRAFT_451738 [Stachybotrys elegans]|uniref:Uncharacterized protein n=1 Tax=Stachybotrys elegans TaxID=80388 RepID=A0A8K0SQ74_9HYPO|nr:hypothetical protein B0I35DRAFT_451738 [Stachybotrys elegans]
MLWVRYLRALLGENQWQSSLTMDTEVQLSYQASFEMMYESLVREFAPKEQGIFGSDRVQDTGLRHYSNIAICVRALLPLSFTGIPTLDQSLLGLLSLYYGSLHGDAGLKELAYSSYVFALGQYSLISCAHLHIGLDADVRISERHNHPGYRKPSTPTRRSKSLAVLRTTSHEKGWLSVLQGTTSEPLYWSRNSPATRSNKAYDSECIPRYSNYFHQLTFLCGPVTGLLVQHWSYALQLNMTSIELQRNLLSYVHGVPEKLESRETLSRGLEREKTMADSTAQLILEAEPFLSSCYEGLICLQTPLRIVSRYFDSLN